MIGGRNEALVGDGVGGGSDHQTSTYVIVWIWDV